MRRIVFQLSPQFGNVRVHALRGIPNARDRARLIRDQREQSLQLVRPGGQVVQRKVLHFAKTGSKATLSFSTAKLAKGRYLTIWQFTGTNGWAGPVVVRNLLVR